MTSKACFAAEHGRFTVQTKRGSKQTEQHVWAPELDTSVFAQGQAGMQALRCRLCHTCPVSQVLISLAVLGKAKVNGLQRRIFIRCQVQEVVWLDIPDQHIARMTLGDCSQDIAYGICCICKHQETCQVAQTLPCMLCMEQSSILNLSASYVLTRSGFCRHC